MAPIEWDQSLFDKVGGLPKEEVRKPDCYAEHFKSMADGAKRAGGGSKAFTPKDLELFHASKFQQKLIFRGYDKITTSNSHKEGEPWNVPLEVIAKLSAK